MVGKFSCRKAHFQDRVGFKTTHITALFDSVGWQLRHPVLDIPSCSLFHGIVVDFVVLVCCFKACSGPSKKAGTLPRKESSANSRMSLGKAACHEVRERTWNARLLVTTVRGLSWSWVQATWVFCDSLTAFLEATQVADPTLQNLFRVADSHRVSAEAVRVLLGETGPGGVYRISLPREMRFTALARVVWGESC